MKKYVYFVSFAYSSEKSFGFSNGEIISTVPIKTYQDVAGMADSIKTKNTVCPNGEITIINYKLLRIEVKYE